MNDDHEMDLVQMKAALNAAADGVTPDQVTAIEKFIDRIGGLENAQSALKMLAEIEDGAA